MSIHRLTKVFAVGLSVGVVDVNGHRMLKLWVESEKSITAVAISSTFKPYHVQCSDRLNIFSVEFVSSENGFLVPVGPIHPVLESCY